MPPDATSVPTHYFKVNQTSLIRPTSFAAVHIIASIQYGETRQDVPAPRPSRRSIAFASQTAAFTHLEHMGRPSWVASKAVAALKSG
mmetsp:Transcript_43891/g.102563  ORF Transcript_43891/g.102563 Transcript_43891/m.102563 type:complete len:87 (-) Transcript_43891:1001-1261(-)